METTPEELDIKANKDEVIASAPPNPVPSYDDSSDLNRVRPKKSKLGNKMKYVKKSNPGSKSDPSSKEEVEIPVPAQPGTEATGEGPVGNKNTTQRDQPKKKVQQSRAVPRPPSRGSKNKGLVARGVANGISFIAGNKDAIREKMQDSNSRNVYYQGPDNTTRNKAWVPFRQSDGYESETSDDDEGGSSEDEESKIRARLVLSRLRIDVQWGHYQDHDYDYVPRRVTNFNFLSTICTIATGATLVCGTVLFARKFVSKLIPLYLSKPTPRMTYELGSRCVNTASWSYLSYCLKLAAKSAFRGTKFLFSASARASVFALITKGIESAVTVFSPKKWYTLHRYELIDTIESPTIDMRPDDMVNRDLLHSDPDLVLIRHTTEVYGRPSNIVHWMQSYFNEPTDPPVHMMPEVKPYDFAYKVPRHRKTVTTHMMVSLELLSQLTSPTIHSDNDSDETMAGKLEQRVSKIVTVNLDRANIFTHYNVATNTVQLAFAMWKMRRELHSPIPFISAPVLVNTDNSSSATGTTRLGSHYTQKLKEVRNLYLEEFQDSILGPLWRFHLGVMSMGLLTLIVTRVIQRH